MFDLLKEGIKSAWDLSLGFDSQMQQNQIAFESMLGSADKAGNLISKLSQMAADTPFEFPQLTDATKKLLAFGFSASEIPDMLTKIGDASSGLGLGADGVNRITIALGQMQAKGKVSAQEMMQLTEAGIPAWDILAKAMGKSTAEVMALSEKGLIPADSAIKKLVDGMEQRFPNMMDKQSKSFQGLMSTLKDNVQMTLGDIVKPAFEYLTNNILPVAIEETGKFQKAFKMDGLKGVLDEIFPSGLSDVIIALGNNIKNTIGFVVQHGDALKAVGIITASVVLGMKAYEASLLAVSIANGATIAKQEISNALMVAGAIKAGGMAAAQDALAVSDGSATVAQLLLNAAMEANPVGLVIAGVTALIAVIGGLIYAFDDTGKKKKELTQQLIDGYEKEKAAALEALDKESKAQKDSIDSMRDAEDQRHSQSLKNIQDTYDAEVEAAKNTEKALKDSIEKRKQAAQDAHSATLDRIKEEYDAEVDAQQKTEQALQNTLEERKRQAEDAHNKVMSDIEVEYNAQLKSLDEETNSKVKALQDQISAIDDKTKQEDKLNQEAQNNEKILNLQSAIDHATTAEDKAAKTKELADFETQLQRQKLLDEREAEKAALSVQITDLQSATADKKTKMQEELKDKQNLENAKYSAAQISLDNENKAITAKYENEKKVLDTELKNKQDIENEKYKTTTRALEDESKAIDGYADRKKKVLDKELADKQTAENEKYKSAKAAFDAEASALQDAEDKKRKAIQATYDLKEKLAKGEADKQVGPSIFGKIADEWTRETSNLGKVFSGDLSGLHGSLFGTILGYASGTDNATPGVHLVGENGPELVTFGGGEKVFNSSQTSNILNGGSNKSQQGSKTVNVYGDIHLSSKGDMDTSLQQIAYLLGY